ncbi:MAG: hypothetical protein ACOY5U_00465 [Pseudomonadota bacterium]
MISGSDFPVLDPWQYRLGERRDGDSIPLGSLWLSCGPDLPVIRVRDSGGAEVGVLLGFPIDLAGKRLLTSDWIAPDGAADTDPLADRVLHALGGRFLWIQTTGGKTRIYPDCSAQVTCVWDTERPAIGSTAHALLDDAAYEARFDHALYDRLGLDGEGWFPAGLTAHRGIERLLPDHYLDAESRTAHRFWPRQAVPPVDPQAAVDEMIALIRAQMEAIIGSDRRLGLALTGGHETRMLLACARPFLDRIDIVTVVGEDRHATDTVIARRIVRDFGLRHLELPRRQASDAERQTFIRRGGHCNADSNSRFHPSMRPIARTHHFIGGLGGEVGRAFFWRGTDVPSTPITAEVLNARFGLPAVPELTGRLRDWLRDLPSTDAYGILDLAYLEHRNGPWYAAQFCTDPTLVRFAPIFTLRGVELMLGLPPQWKRESRLGHEIIRKLWPELLDYPFNSLGAWRDALIKAQKVMANPRLIVKKLRKMRR